VKAKVLLQVEPPWTCEPICEFPDVTEEEVQQLKELLKRVRFKKTEGTQ